MNRRNVFGSQKGRKPLSTSIPPKSVVQPTATDEVFIVRSQQGGDKDNLLTDSPYLVIQSQPYNTHTHLVMKRAARLWRIRVLASTHSKLHRLKMLQTSFCKWRLKKYGLTEQWKAHIRAAVHFKYLVCGKAWRSWREFVHLVKLARANAFRAHSFALHKQKSVAFSAWSQYIKARNTKRKQCDKAEAAGRGFIMTRYWRVWKRVCGVRKERMLRFDLADRVCGRMRLNWTYLKWKSRFLKRKKLMMVEQYAAIHSDRRILKHAFGIMIRQHRLEEKHVLLECIIDNSFI